MEECGENVDEAKLSEIALAENENSYKLRRVFCVILDIFTINVGGISDYFLFFHGRLKKMFTRETTIYKTHKMVEINQIDIKNRTYYFYNDTIDLKHFDARLLEIDKKSYKNIGIYNIGYITIKKIDDYENIYSVNPLYLIIDHASGYIEKEEINKYFIFDSTNKNKW